MRTITLSNGVKMPMIGLGTWQMKEPVTTRNTIQKAIDIGYRHIDTANIYKNEHIIGEILELNKELLRSDLFITSKVPPTRVQNSEQVLSTFNKTLQDLKTDYVDLYLIHWPGASKVKPTNADKLEQIRLTTWSVLEQLYEQGKCRAIGVSNFNEDHLSSFIEKVKIKPHVNQIEYHPLFWKRHSKLEAICKDNNIVLQGYSPFAQGAIFEYGITSGQALKWCVFERNVVVLPKSIHEERLKDNFMSIQDGEGLSKTESDKINMLNVTKRVCWDPDTIK
ncbi:9,11-endoperoxide prostaglandin H2 reductase [Acrasis kona]|uniref:9,11-endoperoxide prostaglandin H2 reductase n=1 Tax=Acrasis kona TaxID=1008807 RepID=A0AAW2ZFS4_9EUKA